MLFALVKAEVVSLPTQMNAIDGRNISVKCDAKGKPAATITWLRNGAPLRNQPQDFIDGRNSDNTFRTTSTLTLSPARKEDNGKFGCQAENAHGSDIRTVTLNLLCK